MPPTETRGLGTNQIALAFLGTSPTNPIPVPITGRESHARVLMCHGLYTITIRRLIIMTITRQIRAPNVISYTFTFLIAT